MSYRCWRYRFKSEVPSIDFVRHADFSGRTLLDIGANRGIYSIYMSRAAGPRGKVIAFEPQPELKSHLETVRAAFGLGNLGIEAIGLSSASGSLELYRPKVGSGSATAHAGNHEDWERFEVPVRTLDDYLETAAVGPVHFIKCDVEDHEFEVFRGAERTLSRDHPALLFECFHDTAARGEIFGFLADLGYAGYFYYVDPKDHRSLFHKNRGTYVPAEKFDQYAYPRAGVLLRNYVFLQRGLDPAAVHRGEQPPGGS